MSTKSANYCNASRDEPVGLLLMCEVALGKTRQLVASDYRADKLPDGFVVQVLFLL
jgi:poly [ADP-ribose] polymerase